MSTNTKMAEPVNAAAVLRNVLNTLKRENDKPDGSISDTIWYSAYETLFDYVESSLEALAAHEESLRDNAEQAQRQPLTDEQADLLDYDRMFDIIRGTGYVTRSQAHEIVDLLRAHGIGATTGEQR